MSLASMMTESVVIQRRTGGDEYDEVPTFPVVATVSAFVARQATTEEVAGRDQVVADYSFILPAGTDVQPYDRLIHLARTFEVVGLPAPAVKPGSGAQFVVAKARWVEG